MQLSFLIVTKNRTEDLTFTLNRLKEMVDISKHEVLVFIDGCKETEKIRSDFDWVNWTVSPVSISASPARNTLYNQAKGNYFIGLDDDAHPISNHFIKNIETEFESNKTIGILAFQEVRGCFDSDQAALEKAIYGTSHFTNDFVGCGFAIRKTVYHATNGFPVWMDIYGEESALALEVLDSGFAIKYVDDIIVNHRVDVTKRKKLGRNYFRFEHQLRNTLRYYLVYYPKPTLQVVKALAHNFRKYAVKDMLYFRSFMKVFFFTLYNLPIILKSRKPVRKETLELKKELKNLTY
ncbi:glycosyltransferase family 2 protein [Lacinutrix sp. Hel_I_90]|uniref:glycosyltransferase family 2 protein n=1 Tax=Lacinutrix sp. Hel_I_90 TaxID=1249999 RepID=UPI0005C9FADC|nr:glycosyltransferase [Lacinutrix sp. Hel_I_90]